MNLNTIEITRSDFNLPTMKRRNVPLLSVFVVMTNEYYLNVGELDGTYYSVNMRNPTKEVMNYAVTDQYFRGADTPVTVVGQVVDMSFTAVDDIVQKLRDTAFGDVVYLRDVLYPGSDDHIPFMVLRRSDDGGKKALLSVGTGEWFGKLRFTNMDENVAKVGAISATIVRV